MSLKSVVKKSIKKKPAGKPAKAADPARVAPGPVTRPEFTMPAAERALLTEAYTAADVILEYGSGGSTLMAAEMAGKTITSVESDEGWAAMMRGWFAENPPAPGSSVTVHWADIGPTKAWGFPQNNMRFEQYPTYPLGVWDAGEMAQPDVVLVDGRFRVGCALATALMTKKPVDLYVDDYTDRDNYHVIERWLGTPKTTGRMAHFKVDPMPLEPGKLMRLMQLMLNKS